MNRCCRWIWLVKGIFGRRGSMSIDMEYMEGEVWCDSWNWKFIDVL